MVEKYFCKSCIKTNKHIEKIISVLKENNGKMGSNVLCFDSCIPSPAFYLVIRKMIKLGIVEKIVNDDRSVFYKLNRC